MTKRDIEDDICYVEKYLLEHPGSLLAKQRLEELYALLEALQKEQVQSDSNSEQVS